MSRLERVPAAGTVGIVGLGTMGSAMSGLLLRAGYTVIGYDIALDALARHRERGGTEAASAAEVFANSRIVISSLPSAAAFEALVWAGPPLMGPTPGPGVLIETSTLARDMKLAAAKHLRRSDVVLLDCPMSGTGAQALRGDLVAYLSGDDDEAKAAALPVLDEVTRAAYDVGGLGEGTRVKLVANLLVAVHNVAAAEALQLAFRCGMDLDTVLRAVSDGAGTSRMLEVRGPMMVGRTYAPATMRTDTFGKDLALIAEMVAASDAPSPLFNAAVTVYREALAAGMHTLDTACVFEVLSAPGTDESG